MTVTDAFNTFKSDLELTSNEQTEATRLHTGVREELEDNIFIYDTFLTGSFSRDTKIRPLHDIDMFAILDSGQKVLASPGSGVTALDALIRVMEALRNIKNRYPTASNPKLQRRSVNIIVGGIGFDIVPAYYRSGSGYLVPDKDLNMWLHSNPPAYNKFLSDFNQQKNDKLIPLIKMIKCWSRNNGDVLKSYHLEWVILTIFFNRTISSYSSAASIFFSNAGSAVTTPITEPFSGLRLDNCMSPLEIVQAQNAIQRGSSSAINALLFEILGQHNDAIRSWRSIFKDPFPIV